MANEILVPSLGESITEATVSKWLKQVGEQVSTDEPLVELETDKVNVEVPSPLAGTLSSISVKEGDSVGVGSILGVVSEGKLTATAKIEPIKVESEVLAPSKIRESKKINKKMISTAEDNPTLVEENKKENSNGALLLDNLVEEDNVKEDNVKEDNVKEDNVKEDNIEEQETREYVPPKSRKNLSPSVKKIIKEQNIDISNIEPSGPKGNIVKADLLKLMGDTPAPSARKDTHGPEERVKMTKLRTTIAKRLKQAQNSAAMLTTFNEVDMHNIMEMKKNYQEDFKKKYSIKLGFMSFFTKASVVALKNFPAVNAQIEGDQIIYKNYYNICIAIGTDRGLVVPVLKKADELSFAEIEKNIFSLSEKARLGKITINDLQGGTFTISNGGIYGSMLSTPILNPPQTGILGMHNVVERPVVKDGNIVSRPIMYLALSYDHRIIDGKEAVSFLKTIKECLEEPRRLFLDL